MSSNTFLFFPAIFQNLIIFRNYTCLLIYCCLQINNKILKSWRFHQRSAHFLHNCGEFWQKTMTMKTRGVISFWIFISLQVSNCRYHRRTQIQSYLEAPQFVCKHKQILSDVHWYNTLPLPLNVILNWTHTHTHSQTDARARLALTKLVNTSSFT